MRNSASPNDLRAMTSAPDPAPTRAHGQILLAGNIRARPEDFMVDEQLGFEADGEGPHRLVQIEKTNATTSQAVSAIARGCGLAPRDVGYCGLKDRHAVTRQWITLPATAVEPQPGQRFEVGEHGWVNLLSVQAQRRKLRRGAHRANAFVLKVTALHAIDAPEAGLSDAAQEWLAQRLAAVAQIGVPNYFGPQRYAGGRNLANARAMFESGTRLRREQRSHALSAARSLIFDQVLQARVEAGSWNQLLAGDVASLAGSASWFPVEAPDATLAERLAQFDIHPSGPLWGRGELPSTGPVAHLEQQIGDAQALYAQGLEAAGMKQDRRALRLYPEALSWSLDGADLTLQFSLPRGAYATTVLAELLQIHDVSRRTRTPPA